jgi:ABC-type branched-subunit amino acid transport system ATPase component
VRDHISALFGTPAIRESEADVAFTVDDLVELMGLGAFRDKFVNELSTGSRRVVDLACVIAHEPTVLLLDEPSAGLNRDEREDLARFILRIKHELGVTMIWIEHDMQMVADLADRIHVLDYGRTIADGPPAAVLKNARVRAAYLGTSVV